MIANCLGCKDAVEYESFPPVGWVVETRPTLGGGTTEYQMCFSCRKLLGLPGHTANASIDAGSPRLIPLRIADVIEEQS